MARQGLSMAYAKLQHIAKSVEAQICDTCRGSMSCRAHKSFCLI